jgi:hypothetical protein
VRMGVGREEVQVRMLEGVPRVEKVQARIVGGIGGADG